jgi:hypothetical protein
MGEGSNVSDQISALIPGFGLEMARLFRLLHRFESGRAEAHAP